MKMPNLVVDDEDLMCVWCFRRFLGRGMGVLAMRGEYLGEKGLGLGLEVARIEFL